MEKIEFRDLNEAVKVMYQDSGLTMSEFGKVTGIGSKQNVNNVLSRSKKTGKYPSNVGVERFCNVANRLGYKAFVLIEKII